MSYSLASRELLAMAAELHYRSGHFDAWVAVSSCDKAIPAHLIAAARLNSPVLFFPGGVMHTGPGDISVDRMGELYARLRRGEISEDDYRYHSLTAAPCAGACNFLGTAVTMQILTEALGLALPTSACCPTTENEQSRLAKAAGAAAASLLTRGLTARDFISSQAMENALVIHAAAGDRPTPCFICRPWRLKQGWPSHGGRCAKSTIAFPGFSTCVLLASIPRTCSGMLRRRAPAHVGGARSA